MSDPYYGEIKMVGFYYPPLRYAFCSGQTMKIAQQGALFSLIGNIYGGDGHITFCLPDLRGRVPIHSANGDPGPYLSRYDLGEKGGDESSTLRENQMPWHNHDATVKDGSVKVRCNSGTSDSKTPKDNFWSQVQSGPTTYSGFNSAADTTMNANAVTLDGLTVAVGDTGGTMPYSLIQPYLAVNFVIALEGVYPPRN